jgi:hypothetical protein
MRIYLELKSQEYYDRLLVPTVRSPPHNRLAPRFALAYGRPCVAPARTPVRFPLRSPQARRCLAPAFTVAQPIVE